jgi:cystathionine beta-lyase
MAPSKTFNLAGLRCGFAVISDGELRGRFRRAMKGLVPGPNSLGMSAVLAAYRGCREWHGELLAYLRANRDLVEARVASTPGLSMTRVEATYLAWIDARALGRDRPAELFEAAGVGLWDGADFGAPGFLRLNFACPRGVLAEALRRMERAAAGR